MNSHLLVIIIEILYKSSMLTLNPHKNNPNNAYKVNAQVRKENDFYFFDFDVNLGQKPHTSSDFATEGYQNWGLWEFDVTEVFIQRRSQADESTNPYLEIQVSPLGQKFAHLIKTPRKDFDYPKSVDSFTANAQMSENGFKSCLKIKASDIPGSGELIYFNLFACLGPKESRCYFALNINNDTNADYHKPELFKVFD